MKQLINSHKFLKIIFGLGLFIILCLGGLSYRHIENLTETTKLVEHAYEINLELERIQSSLHDVKASQRGYILSKDSMYLEPFFSGKEKIIKNLAGLRNLTNNNSIQQKNLDTLSFNVINKINFLIERMDNVASINVDSEAFKLAFKGSKKYEDEITNKISEMIALEIEFLRLRQNENEENLNITPFLLYSSLILTLILLLIAYAKINYDIETLRVANQKLEISNNLSKQAEIIGKHGTWAWDMEKEVYQFSDNLYRLLGEEPQSFEPNLDNFYSFVHKDDKQNLALSTKKMFENENLPFVKYRIKDRKGNIKYFKSYGKLVVLEDGGKQLIGITTDITEEVKNLEIIERRNKELELNNKELSTFNYVASHDLQEPLRKIQTFISRLESKDNDRLSEDGKLYIERIKSSSSRMRLLIDDLLQYSRTSKSDHNFTETNMNLLLEHAKDDLADSIIESKIEIKADDLPNMEVISFQIQQLFINLLNNSIKYRRKDVKPIVEISYKEVKSKKVKFLKSSLYKFHHHISFKDNGIGFDQSYAEKIFVLFKRLHGKSEYSGTGIGLSICKKIVENHNGIIVAKGEPNKGATFDIFLPFIK